MQTDTTTPFGDLLDSLTAATLAVRDAAGHAAGKQVDEAETLKAAITNGDLDSGSASRSDVWDALFEVYRRSAELADLWNDVAPRAGRT